MTQWLTRTLCVLVLFTNLCPLAVNAQVAEDRVAFIIGNGGYPKSLALKNPLNDATAIEKQLSVLGFETKSYKDLKIAEVAGLRQQMESRLKRNSVLFFYYAGHGVQIDGRNYLLTVDATLNDGDKASQESLYLGDVLHAIERMRPKIAVVILDACRDNPFKDQKNSTGAKQGLARVDPPTSTVVFYATRPGGTAQDGEDENGVFTKALLQEMIKPEQPLEVVFRRVSTSVFKSTKSEQEPWIEGVIREEFIVNQGEKFATQPLQLPAKVEVVAVTNTTLEVVSKPVIEESKSISTIAFNDALQKLRSIKISDLENIPTYFACDSDRCENYKSWMERYSSDEIQKIITTTKDGIIASKLVKMCEYSLEKNECLSDDLRIPFYGMNLIVANKVYSEGFSIEKSSLTKSGGVNFSAKFIGGAVFYTGSKTKSNCQPADSKFDFERDKVIIESARVTCLNNFTVSFNKSKINVLMFNYSKNEYIAEIDLSFYGVGFGAVAGGGKKLVKITFQ
ncbi:MAG: hypothetical protein EB072_05705 [Betaproteobacteria bacterium]|nr:hypothetical protein [Betaproteobacteria bacterium]